MFILRKKKIYMMLSLVLVGILSFYMQQTPPEESVATVSFPVSNKVIIIDAGHGKPDEGAESSRRNNRSRN